MANLNDLDLKICATEGDIPSEAPEKDQLILVRGEDGGGGGVPSVEATESMTLGDNQANKFVLANHASTPIVLTIPTAATYAFANDTEIAICRYGEADVSVKTESGVVLNGQDSTKSFKISEQYNSVAIKKISDTAWVMSGAFDDPV